MSKILSSGKLQLNETKTEVMSFKKSNNDTEGWRKIKKLVSFLGDRIEIKNRKRLTNIAFNKVEYIWLRRRNISIQRRVNMLVYYSTIAVPGGGGDNPEQKTTK